MIITQFYLLVILHSYRESLLLATMYQITRGLKIRCHQKFCVLLKAAKAVSIYYEHYEHEE